ncbi:MAG: peptidylprolyl isomerase [Bacteroidales bacterium]
MRTKFLLATLALSSLLSIHADNDPVLMKINGKEIRKSEFEYIYRKNNQQQTTPQKGIDEYVDLFVNFKLKVAEAEARGIDTTSAFIKELTGYRQQLAQPYLTDKNVEERLVREAYDRLTENVEVSHILLRLDPDASEEEARKVYNKLTEMRKKLLKGYDFGKLAKEVSQDPSAQNNNGYLGFISGFMTVYPFETAAYATPVGEISEPVKTSFGYHLVKVHSRRKDQGEVLVAHIMKMVPKDADPRQDEQVRKEMEEIYLSLRQGADFAEVARDKSEDKYSAVKGGELPWFGSGRMVKEFEEVSFGLKNKGEISKPFRTPYGWHIAKLTDKRGIPSFDEKKQEIVKRIANDERARKGSEEFVARLKSEYNFTLDAKGDALLSRLAKEFSPVDSFYQAEAEKAALPLFKIADKIYSTADFAKFVAKNKRTMAYRPADVLREKKQQFIETSLLAYEDGQLERKYPEFRNLMQEYRDGILLFEVSNKEVWEKASNDTSGLKAFFDENKSNYKWDTPRFKGFVIQCKDKSTRKAAKKILKKAPADSVAYYLKTTLNSDSTQFVRVEKGLYSLGDHKIVDAISFKKGSFTPSDSYPIVFFEGKKLKKGPESYLDVRGLVTSDYQNYLEKRWMEELKGKSVVEIDKDVLKTVKPL